MKVYISLFAILVSSASVGEETQDSYKHLLDQIEQKRQSFQEAYMSAGVEKRKAIKKEASTYLFQVCKKKVFPSWYGTPWDFNGTSRTPKQGKIACGYFVTNTLADIGFQIPRIRWAQSASEYFIKILANKKVTRFHDSRPMHEITKFLSAEGDGLYAVGLDAHVGYVLVEGDELTFVHSNYYHRNIGVMSEPLLGFNPLVDSSYRVFGKLFSDEMIDKWLSQQAY